MRSRRRWGRLSLIAGGFAILALIAFIVVAPALLRPGANRLRIVQTPRDYGVTFETVEFRPPDQPITLRAWWMPAEPAKAAIILVHGGGDDNRSLPYADGLKLAHDLVGHGYAVFSVDLRNYGESAATPEGVTVGDAEADDIIGAMNYLGSHHPGLRYGGLGFSMGGEVLLYAAARDARLEAVVTTDTFTDVRSVAANFVSAQTGLPVFVVVPLLWSAEHLHGVPLSRGRAIDVVGAIPPRPGTPDSERGRPHRAGRALPAAGRRHSRFRGVDHGGSLSRPPYPRLTGTLGYAYAIVQAVPE